MGRVLTSGPRADLTRRVGSKRTPARRRKTAKAPIRKKPPRLSPAEAARRQTMIVELVALLVAPGHGVDREDAERIARKVVNDHPGAWTSELVPMVVAHLERHLVDEAA